MILHTARLTLRPARASDLLDMHRDFTDPRAMRYWSRPPHDSLDTTRAFLDAMIEAEADAYASVDFIVERDGIAIGKCGAWRLPEVGFILHPDHWRQGLGHEALSAVVAHLFACRDLPFLTAEADPRNVASLGLLARFGFRETHRAARTMQWGEEWCDSVYLRLDRADQRSR